MGSNRKSVGKINLSFDHRDIRLAMDVYTFDNVYLDTVLKITAVASAPVVEQTRRVKHQRSAMSGEILGPMPTQPIGNAGPRVQGAANTSPQAPTRPGRSAMER